LNRGNGKVSRQEKRKANGKRGVVVKPGGTALLIIATTLWLVLVA